MAKRSLQPAFRAVRRGYAARDILEQLARAILRRELQPGAKLPSESELAERFGVSRIIVRQAVHGLAEMGLLRVRQGGATLILDPEDATDLRVFELLFRFGPSSDEEERAFVEHQMMQIQAMLVLADRRGTDEELEAVAQILEDYAERGAPDDGQYAFQTRLARALSQATHNRIYKMEASWFIELAERHPDARRRLPAHPTVRAMVFREMARHVRQRKSAAFHQQIVATRLEHLEPKGSKR